MPSTRSQKCEEEMEAALKTFFSSPRFAVAGASSDPNKYGHKSTLIRTPSDTLYEHMLTIFTVFAWYLRHSLPATPINPRSPTVNILKRDHTTVPSPTALSDPPASSYSLSVITPPAVTKQLLKEAKEAGIPAVWLQPGSFDREVLEYAQANFKAAIGGNGGGGSEGWCVLVDGEEGLRLAEREWSRL
jgi:predicted CoA-binding protein